MASFLTAFGVLVAAVTVAVVSASRFLSVLPPRNPEGDRSAELSHEPKARASGA